MDRSLRFLSLASCLLALASCRPPTVEPATQAPEPGALAQVGSIVITAADLEHELKEKHLSDANEAIRQKALDELIGRAQWAQAALDEKLEREPAVRAEVARALAAQLRERQLAPRLKAADSPVPEARLRELYEASRERFFAPEKRQVAVLWLNPNQDPERARQYVAKLEGARTWLLGHAELKDRPEQGFSVLSVDHTEHAGSRYKGGDVGWLERAGGLDAWTKAVAEIAFALDQPGAVSAVTPRAEGVFLVRLIAVKPAVQRPFEQVAKELERTERQRLRAAGEAEYQAQIKARYPARKLTP